MKDVSATPSAARLAALLGDVGADRGPLYRAVAAALRRRIADGRLPVGARLPAERALADALGVSRVTVAAAYSDLRDDGWALTRHGAGTFVAAPDGRQPWGTALGAPVPGVLDLGNAAPEASSLLTAAYAVAQTRLPDLLAGHGYAPSGLPELRAAVAARYTARGLPTDPEQVLITAAAADGLDAVLHTVVGAGRRVLHQHPSHPGALETIAAAGAQSVAVPVDVDDPDVIVDEADRAARQHAPTVAYLMPDHANPTGASLSVAARRSLAATLWRHRVLTVVDEVAAELSFAGDDIEPFGAAVPDAATVHVGSLSKVVWGGIRIGWVRGDRATVARVREVLLRRQLGVSILDQLAAVELFAQWQRILDERRAGLRARQEALAAAVAARLPGWRFVPPAGGLSLWCRLPDGIGSTRLVAAAERQGLVLLPGTRFGTGHAFDDHQRLPFTRPVAELLAAVDVLAGLGAAVLEPRRAAPPLV
ncbi:MocR-like transcription factor YczR [Rhodococcus sp. 2H158]